MSPELLSSLIALSGVVVSILVSSFLNTRQTKVEIKKMRTEVQMSYASKLVEKRMEIYPILASLLSDFEKAFKFGVLQQSAANKLLKEVNQWDSSYLLFTSTNATKKFTEFRVFLVSLKKLSKKDFDSYISDVENKKIISRQIRELEIALKQDLGIFVVEFSDIDRNLNSYSDVSELVLKQQK